MFTDESSLIIGRAVTVVQLEVFKVCKCVSDLLLNSARTIASSCCLGSPVRVLSFYRELTWGRVTPSTLNSEYQKSLLCTLFMDNPLLWLYIFCENVSFIISWWFILSLVATLSLKHYLSLWLTYCFYCYFFFIVGYGYLLDPAAPHVYVPDCLSCVYLVDLTSYYIRAYV